MNKEELMDIFISKNDEELSDFIRDNFYKTKSTDYQKYKDNISLLKKIDKDILNLVIFKMNAYDNVFSTVKDFSLVAAILTPLLSYYISVATIFFGGNEIVTKFVMVIFLLVLMAVATMEYTKTRGRWVTCMFFKELLESIK